MADAPPLWAQTFRFALPGLIAVAAALSGEFTSATDIAGVLIAMAGILAVQLSQAAIRT